MTFSEYARRPLQSNHARHSRHSATIQTFRLSAASPLKPALPSELALSRRPGAKRTMALRGEEVAAAEDTRGH